MSPEDEKMLVSLIETTQSAIDTGTRIHQHVLKQDESIAKLISANQHLVDDNNKMCKFAEEQLKANQHFLNRIKTLEAFIFIILLLECYKVIAF